MGRCEMEDIMAAPGLDNLHIIEAGPVPANPSELLSTPAMTGFLHAVRDVYDVVLVDTPPILPVTDSAIVASQADGVILVYQAGKVGRLVLKRAKVNVENVGGKVWGVVLNDVKSEIAGYAYTQYYTHYYGEETVVDRRQERFQRVGGFLRRLFHREGRGDAATVSIDGVAAHAAGEPSTSARALGTVALEGPVRGPRIPRRLWMAVLVVALLLALGGLAGFAVEFGPFMTAPEAERVERQLNEAGYQTVRFRQQTGAALYAVLIEKIPSARDARALVDALREQGFGDAFVIGEREPLSVQVGLPLPLRGAVQTAEHLRTSGHQVRVAVQPGEAVTFAIRHGNFATSQEAEAKGQELIRLGLGNQVVRVK